MTSVLPDLEIVSGDSVPDEDSVPNTGANSEWFNQDFAYSTSEHPYGYFELQDGSPDFSRPRKRRPKGYGGSTSTSPATGSRPAGNAKTAAALLARMNMLLGLGLLTLGMHSTAEQLKSANESFEAMAYDALLNDPALCKKILSAGASSGKSQLIMAYTMLGVAIAPAAIVDIKAKRIEASIEDGTDNG